MSDDAATEKRSPKSPRSATRSRAAALGVAVMLAAFAPKLYAQLRVAVVDMQRALLETDQGRRAKQQLKTLFQTRQVELDAAQDVLRREREELERQRNTLSREELGRRMDAYQKQFVDLQQNYLQYQQELSQREAELTKQIYVNLQAVVRQLGAQENLTAVFEQSGVVWAPQHLDLTDRVVQSYNQQYPLREEPAARGDAGVATRPGGGTSSSTTSTGARDAGTRPRVNPHPREENQQGGGGGGGGGSDRPPPPQ